MTLNPLERNNFAGGAHNRNTADRLPEGFFRHAVNLEPAGGGKLKLRAGYSNAMAGTAVRGALGLREFILVADGTSLIEFNCRTNSQRVLRQIAGAGLFAGTVLNDELYFCTANESLRYDGKTVRRWGVPTMPVQPSVQLNVGGGLIAATYSFAATFVDAFGIEGATGPSEAFISSEGQRATFTLPAPPEGGRVRLYMGFANSTTLYLQHEVYEAGAVQIAQLRDDTATLETQFHIEPPQGSIVEAWKSRILIAVGNVVWMTNSMQPHLVRRSTSFFQYPSPVTVVAPVRDGVFIVADQTYFVRGDGAVVEQDAIHSAVAVAGSHTVLPDKRVAWMTELGSVIGNGDGSLQFVTQDHFLPEITNQGRSTLLQRDGRQTLITTQRGIPSRSGMGMGDFVTGMEIIAP